MESHEKDSPEKGTQGLTRKRKLEEAVGVDDKGIESTKRKYNDSPSRGSVKDIRSSILGPKSPFRKSKPVSSSSLGTVDIRSYISPSGSSPGRKFTGKLETINAPSNSTSPSKER